MEVAADSAGIEDRLATLGTVFDPVALKPAEAIIPPLPSARSDVSGRLNQIVSGAPAQRVLAAEATCHQVHVRASGPRGHGRPSR